MKVLLSIKPEYAQKILSGEKKFEFRKVGFTDSSVRSVVIYATKPVGKLVGEFEILRILVDSPSQIWEHTKKHAGIDRHFFDSYYQGKKQAFAIAVGKVESYAEPKCLSELGVGITPPQSFRYIPNNDVIDYKQREFEL